MWQGGGFDVKTAYKSEEKENHFGIDCEVVYHSVDGENVTSIDINIPGIYRKKTINTLTDIGIEVKKMFLDYIENIDEMYHEIYISAKNKYSDTLDIFCAAIDVSQKCEQYFSAMIYKEFNEIIV